MGYLVGQSVAAATTAPSSGQSICSIAMLSNLSDVHVWKIIVRAGYNSGSPGASEGASGGNIGLYVDDVLISELGVPPSIGLQSNPWEFVMFLEGGEVISAKSIGAGTAGVSYNVHIVVTPAVTPSIV